MGGWDGVGWVGVGKCVSKENPKSDLDLGLRVCQNNSYIYFLNLYITDSIDFKFYVSEYL